MATVDDLRKKLQSDADATPAQVKHKFEKGGVPAGAPAYVRTGALGNDSKPFSLYRFIRHAIAGKDPSSAPAEVDCLERFTKALRNSNLMLATAESQGGYWLPLNFSYFGDMLSGDDKTEGDMRYVKAMLDAGASQSTDPDEEEWLTRKRYIKSQLAYNNEFGGNLIAPPTQGQVVPLIRPDPAFLQAGARSVALPPSGRLVYPRITQEPGAAATAEGQASIGSDLKTDSMVLSAKKISGSAEISEEATAFTSGTMDNYVRNGINRSLALKMDLYGFYGNGGPNQPAGLTNSLYSGANGVINIESAYPNARGVQANGNVLLPEYCDLFEAMIGERSFNTSMMNSFAYVMRPGSWASVTGARADAVAAGDKAGSKVDIIRKTDDQQPNGWAKRNVVRTTNILGNLTKGTGTDLQDVFFGVWEHAIMATYGAMQFTDGYVNNQFLQGFKTIRGLVYGDIGFEYPGAFAWYTKVRGLSALL